MAAHVVIDGSNIATEGRQRPSLAQLREAIASYRHDHPDHDVTVIVDATFPNRIARTERATYEKAVERNEIITPPAGVIGRGDAFILQVADKAGAVVLSNDSFQEFHGSYAWLLEPGRLLGGKPVPHVGWVFVPRAPVRGPVSRKSVRDANTVPEDGAPRVRRRRAKSAAAEAVAAAQRTEPVEPTAKEPAAKKTTRKRRARKSAASQTAASQTAAGQTAATTGASRAGGAGARGAGARSAGARGTGGRAAGGRRGESKRAADGGAVGGVDLQSADGEHYNERLPFVRFVAEHLPGSRVRGQVDRFSSHGAYVTVGDVRCYLPLKNMGDPAPRRARDVVRQGEERELVVDRIDPDRRGVDVALPGFETLLVSDASKPAPEPQAGVVDTEDYSMAVKKAPSRKRAPAKKKAPAKRKSTARKAPASKKAPAKRKATAGKKAPARKSPARSSST